MEIINTELLISWIGQSGLNNSEISRNAKISRGTINNIISGKTCPSTPIIKSLARSLEMNEAIFIEIFFPDIPLKK